MRQVARLAILVMAMVVTSLVAAPHSFLPIEVTQPDGNRISIYASGDEFHNWLHDEDNYTIVQDSNGAYVYAIQDGDSLAPSDLLVGRGLPSTHNIVPGLNLSQEQIKTKYDSLAQMRDYSNGRIPYTGQINNVVIFIKFSDSPNFYTSMSTFQSIFNNPTQNSMKRYFQAASYNQLNIDSSFYPPPNGNIVVAYTDTNPRSFFQPQSPSNPNGYSGDNDRTQREQQLLVRAVSAVSSQIPAILDIDGDNDGYVDNVCFIIQGQPDAWANLLWPHRWTLYAALATIHGKRVWDYNFQLESSLSFSGASVLSHEMFHSLGAPDLYRYNNTAITPIGAWDLMANNLDPPQHMSAWMKHKYGHWIAEVPTITTSGTYTLSPVASSSTNNIYRINSWRGNEYYVLEYRKQSGQYDGNLPGTGLLVYRLDTREEGNANGPPDELYIYRPGGTNTVNGYLNQAAFSAQSGRTEISEATALTGFAGNGSPGGLNLFDVGYAGETISFKVKISDVQLTSPHGGEMWFGGSNKTITWKSKYSNEAVQLDYSYDGGETWNLIAVSVPNTGSYTWNNLPYMFNSNNVHIRVTLMYSGEFDINYYPFTVTGGSMTPPRNLTATLIDRDVNLNWWAPLSIPSKNGPNTRDFLGYKVYRDGIFLATVVDTTYIDPDPGIGTFIYTVTASYTNGESGPAGPAIVDLEPILPSPQNLQANVVGTTAHLTWDAPADPNEANRDAIRNPQLVRYIVYRDGTMIASVNQTCYSNAYVPLGTHTYAVTGYYNYGESEPSDTLVVVIANVPRPSDLTAESVDNRVTLNWVCPAAPDTIAIYGFKVYRGGNLIATITDPDAVTYTDIGLPNGNYTYGVSALHTYGETQSATVATYVYLLLSELVYADDFESYPDFATEFTPWFLIDEDLAYTSGFTGVEFPGSGSQMAYIIFNPSATVPPLEGVTCHSGNKMAACFPAINAANSDYLISRRVHLGTNSKLRFFARSHFEEPGLARFRVGISTQPTISTQFEWLDANYMEAPTDWTDYVYNLSSYNGSDVYLTILCNSVDATVFYVDDVSIHSDDGYIVSSDDNSIPALATRLDGNYPNPFNPNTTIRYSLKEASPVSIEIYNLKGQLVRTLINENKEAGNHTIVWNGLDKNNRSVSSGVFLYRMKAGKYSSTRKMIMLE